MLKLIGIIFLFLIVIVIFMGGEDKQTYTSSNQTQTTARTNEITMTDDMRNSVTTAIKSAGFNCPEAKIAWAKGEDAYGTVTKIFCGPKGQSGVYQNAVFRLTFLPNDQIRVEPWK